MDYGKAVAHLANMALNQSGSGGRVAAAVLISANSGAFTVKIPDLCLLDHEGFRAAMAVIEGRVLHRRDAEAMLKDGPDIMRRIFQEWRGVLLPDWKG